MATNVALGKHVLERDIRRPKEATNGKISGYDKHDGYTSFRWPGTLTVDLQQRYDLRCIRFLLWDDRGKNPYAPIAPRRYQYQLLTSLDGSQWLPHFETGEGGSIGWQVFETRRPIPARYIRIHGISHTDNSHFHVVEVEAYERRPAPPDKAEIMLHASIEASVESEEPTPPHVERTEIDSLGALLSYVDERCAGREYLFRGQGQRLPLLPRIARLSPRGELASIERRMLAEFRRRASPFLESPAPDSNWEWLALAQHHGLPTRLLDWTANPIAALWFAVQAARTRMEPGVVWMFEVEETDHAVTTDEHSPFDCSKTQVFRPRPIAARISAQSGWFTVHKYMADKKRFVPLERNRAYSQRLHALEIPCTSFPSIRTELDRCAFNSAAMFPGLDGLCEHLGRQFTFLGDEPKDDPNAAASARSLPKKQSASGKKRES